MLLFLNMGEGEMLVIVLVILLFFGSKSIPGIAKSLGKGLRDLKDATQEIQREIENSANSVTKVVDDHVKSIEKEVNTMDQEKKSVVLSEEPKTTTTHNSPANSISPSNSIPPAGKITPISPSNSLPRTNS